MTKSKKELLEELRLEQALAEIQQRKEYQGNFYDFAKDKIKIMPKDTSKGFQPFILNDAQKEVDRQINEQLQETGRVRAIILKARQQGISTYCAGRVFWRSYFRPHTKAVIIAHDATTSSTLFDMSKNLIANMDDDYKPALINSNAREIKMSPPHFRKEGNIKPRSEYRLYTAGSPEAGRGTTGTVAHGSEVAFWEKDDKIVSGLFQGIAEIEGSEVILESTANGAQGEFYRLWKGAVEGSNGYLPIFLPWNFTKEYQKPLKEGEEFIPTEEEEGLIEQYELTYEQLNWRRTKIAESGPIKFRQEYPINADEAFIVSGANVFDLDKVRQYIPLKPKSKQEFDKTTGYFKDLRSEGFEGTFSIWEYPKLKEEFVIGADVALGVGKDYSTAVVMRPNGEIVAIYRDNRIDPNSFGDVLYYIGRQFNFGLMAPERNSMGAGTLHQLKELNYPNLYHQTKVANISTETGDIPGWQTTGPSKKLIIAGLKRAIEEHSISIPCAILKNELMTYVSDDRGTTNAIPGETDDILMATAIALEVLRTHADRLGCNGYLNWRNTPQPVEESTWI